MKSAPNKIKILMAGAVLALGVFMISPAWAQQGLPPAPQGFPPAPQGQGQPPAQAQSPAATDPGVARVSYIHGDVSMQRGDSGDTSAVTVNTPLESGDKILTGDASRAEVQLDFANVLRLDEHAQANLATLTNSRIQIQLAQGLTSFEALKGSQADVEIDTPNVSVHPTSEGSYRIQVNPDGDTFITVRDGQAEVSTPQGSTTVQKGELITVHGAGTDTAYQTSNASPADAWDNWNRDRDRAITGAQSVQRTNPYYTGAGDLDPYGGWTEVPDYGQVWIPRVDAGWAPYRAGRWVWEPFYGWTWVSYEPWGWAPYHYGRWFLYDSSWAWWPGPVTPFYRPVWAPAYVSFFGFGGGVGIGFGFGFGGFGSIGWLPIGPGDFFHPWYGGFRDHFNVVNVTAIANVHEGFVPLHGGGFSNLRDVTVNDRLRQGVSSVSAGSFGRGAVEARTVSAGDLRGGRAITGGLPVVPSRESLRVSDRATNPAISSRFNGQGQFFSRGTPASRPQTFSDQAAQVRRGIERGGQPAGNSAPQQGNTGWQRFGGQGSPAPSQNQSRGFQQPQPNQNQRQAQGGWQRFGNSAPAANGSRPPQPTYREPLNLSRPIVRERSAPAPSYRGAPSQPSPAYRPAPAPTYRSAPASSYRAPAAPAPRGPSNGGGNRGGGGGGGSRGGGDRRR